MNIEVFIGKWYPSIILENPKKFFIFGDNDQRFGKGGQACIRDCFNTQGIRTKKAPFLNDKNAYYKDLEYSDNILKIERDIQKIKTIAKNYTIVFSENGYGNGFAKLEEKAPATYSYLCKRLKEEFKFDNKTGKLI